MSRKALEDDEPYIVVTWEGEGDRRNRMRSQPMSKKEAEEIARRQRAKDGHVHSSATKERHKGLFGW